MASFICGLCSFVYDEDSAGTPWQSLPDDWVCPVCGSPKSEFAPAAAVSPPASAESADRAQTPAGLDDYLKEWRRTSDPVEIHMPDIHRLAETGEPIIEPMATAAANIGWDNILVKGAQLATIPLNEDVPVNSSTVIGPKSARPLVIDTPLFVTHMSFGALSREAKIALAKGSALAKTAMGSGEGGVLPESLQHSYKYILEYVPNEYSVTEAMLTQVDAVEIKIGQSAKPGLGGHLPAGKVTGEIAEVRGRPEGQDITSPAHFKDILTARDLGKKINWLREKSAGKPIGIKIAAGNIEADLAVALPGGPDFVTVDGRAGGTGAAPKFVKRAASVPTVFALHRARKFLNEQKAGVSLVITGGFRIPSDFIKALAMGADAIALGTSVLLAVGCQQYRICNTGRCPVGITSQDPELRSRLDIDRSAGRVANFFRAATEEMKQFARMTGHDDVHGLSTADLCTINSEISGFTDIEHV
jgi:glutamate synthase domain-containing protein 2/rubredoxin